MPWLTDENIKFCLSDQVHAVPTYTVIVDSSLEFTTYVYNWPIPDDHKIYNDHKPVRPTYFFTCLTPDDFTHQWGSSAAQWVNQKI
jgi:hypothetical protein